MDVSILAELKEVQVPIQKMMVNNQEQVIMGTTFVLICPKCGQILQQFQPGMSRLDILKSFCSDNEEELNSFMYCTKCGQKLSIMRPLPIDIDVEEKITNEVTV